MFKPMVVMKMKNETWKSTTSPNLAKDASSLCALMDCKSKQNRQIEKTEDASFKRRNIETLSKKPHTTFFVNID